jgi:curli biogenesis system outer membrane secretion channel CsgG
MCFSSLTYAENLTVAVFDFESKGEGIADAGNKISSLIIAELFNDPNIILIERERLDSILRELELSVSKMVNEGEAVKVGKLVGAKILVIGRVYTINEELTIMVKIIATETGRVKTETVKGPLSGKFSIIADEVAKKVHKIISIKGPSMIASVDNQIGKPKTIAIMDFANTTGDKKLTQWGRDYAELLTLEFSKDDRFRLVERKEINKILEEIELNRSGYVDTKNAIKIGRMLGAQIMVLGVLLEINSNLRVDIHLVEPESGKILKADVVEGKRDNFKKMEKELTSIIAKALIDVMSKK